jgi:predicted heme/steroid binding protein
MVDLTLDDLSKYNGKIGYPAYIAYKGVIYDVSDSSWFTDGEHLGIHFCGQDLTEYMSQAPHGEEYLTGIKKIGKVFTQN